MYMLRGSTMKWSVDLGLIPVWAEFSL